MPARNGMGPLGDGPSTGWGRGGCSADSTATNGNGGRFYGGRGARGYGRGFGDGFGGGFGRGGAKGRGFRRFSAAPKRASFNSGNWTLQDEKEALEEEMRRVQSMIDAQKKSNDNEE